MSQEMAEIKKAEIKEAETKDKRDLSAVAGDMCPVCGQKPLSYPYLCVFPAPYWWIECASCGAIYAPLSIRKQKIALSEANLAKQSTIVEA